MSAYLLFLYLCCGAAAGFFSGLLGIGGGLVVVPLLNLIFTAQQNVPPGLMMHIAVGTSLSSILFTSVSSSRAHSRRGAVLWSVVKKMAPYIAAGTLAGTVIAGHLSTWGLRVFFVCYLFVIATQMLFDYYPHARETVPGTAGLAGAGAVIGGVSSMVGLGGGSLSVPFLRYCGVEMRTAVGTSSALAWPIAIAGTLGYIAVGWDAPGLPPYSLGFINIPTTLGIACTSVLFAPMGAKLAHALPVSVLKKVFAVFLYVTAVKMAASVF
ncbi:MAG: sulfite exporter TauE/SafE family protein [Mailhella sp.]|nr:sulfite exporter TauE/SafE family protein [Mailhella sp.]